MTSRSKQNTQLEGVQKFYDRGARSLEKSPHRLGYGTAEDDADGEGVHPEMLRKARQVAHEFSRKELKELLRDCKSSKYVLGISHLMRLASVRKGRQQLIDQMVRHRWSLRELNTEIAKRSPPVLGRGRKRIIPHDQGGQIVVLKRECIRWQRLNQALAPNLKSPRVRKAMKHVLKSMDVLTVAISRSEA